MLLFFLPLAAGCTSSNPPPPPPAAATVSPSRSAAAQAALDRLVGATRSHDRAAFDLTVSGRDPSFRDRARLLYANLSSLPLEQLELRLQPGEQDLPAARRELLGRDAWRQPATVTWRLVGEGAAAEHTVWLTFTLREGIPLLAGTSDTPSGRAAPEPIWWTGPVTAVRSGPASVLVGAGQPAAAWSSRVRAAVTQVQRRLTAGPAAGWSGSVVVEVPASRARFEAVLGSADGGYANIAAVTLPEGPAARAAVRVVVNPDVTRTLSGTGVAIVLLHEMVHVASRSAQSPAPTWLVEGLADYVALQAHRSAAAGAAEPLLQRVRARGAPQQLPADDRFRAAADDLAVSYAEAWLACRYIAERYSPAALQRLYTAVDSGVALDEAVQDELGVSTQELTTGWRRYLVRLAS
ncbi:MAG: peptidase MA family metallohydrolase [Friedmanniella sp.]